jgi:uncharacterized membrane protein HdeD (DUF308 family)
MLASLARNWWVLFLNGLGAIVFGITAFAWPSVVLWTLIVFFGIYCIVDGVTSVMASLSKDDAGANWLMMLFSGILSIAAGVVAMAWPQITGFYLLMLIAAWAIVKGVLEIIAAIKLRKVIKNEWVLIAAGLISICAGAAMMARPAGGALAVIWLIGTMAVVRGVLVLGLSLRLRRLEKTIIGSS